MTFSGRENPQLPAGFLVTEIGVIFSGGKNSPPLNCQKSLDGVSRDENDNFNGGKKISFTKNNFFFSDRIKGKYVIEPIFED